MRNTESVTAAAVANKAYFKAGALSCVNGKIYSYAEKIAWVVNDDTWNVLPAGMFSVTTSKHCNGVAAELHKHGKTVTRYAL